MSRVIIGVMGPGEQATDEECKDAFDLGVQIAQAGWVLLTGGRNAGVMQGTTGSGPGKCVAVSFARLGHWQVGVFSNHSFQLLLNNWDMLLPFEAACCGAKSMRGLTVGILPGITNEHTAPEVDIPIYTGLGQARNTVNVLSSRVVVSCGMCPGTASELSLAIKSGKPTILLKPDEATRRFFSEVSRGGVRVAHEVAAVMKFVRGALDEGH